MDILEALTLELNGTYQAEQKKSVNTPIGKFSSQNSFGIIRKEEYSIKLYCYNNSGVRAVNAIDGSPFKVVLILPFTLKNPVSIYPKTFFQKIFGDSISKTTLSPNAKGLLKKYSIKGSKKLASYILSDDLLTEVIPEHILYITTSIQKNISTISLRPDESVVTSGELKELFSIIDRLGKIISQHKQVLKR